MPASSTKRSFRRCRAGAAHHPGPGPPAGSEIVAEPVELLDVGATVLDFVQPESEGVFRMAQSMADVVRGDTAAPPRTDALSEFKGEVMLATPEWKIGLNVGGRDLPSLRSNGRRVDQPGQCSRGRRHPALRMENRVLQRLIASSSHDPLFAPADIQAGGVSGVARRWLGKSATTSCTNDWPAEARQPGRARAEHRGHGATGR